ncbi:fatty acyl-AMP ligase [Catellatospora citrea]|uniref:Acyl-CoA synthetase (AMP-forming)/AMP-acid ligase II n=1 Tax=Catellatospora citrea TaxID=53366 RepID=A0A8J3P403_9ACTN|nr:fatty acyl-AMP ligase [Catellatospora citrea]RKE10637.1 acyl-CoA synthetase (AMP-forming)/AMP-acid ligase II [Catellatospora citrea]GIG03181.1 hypothetical protein Cci01nite_82740 [Catellatospora citrea]
MSQVPSRPVDLVQVLQRNAEQNPDRIAIRITGQRGLSWHEVDRRAQAVAGSLLKSASPGDRIALVFGTDADFLPALFGCWYAGMVAVPVPPGRHGERAISDARPAVVVTTDDFTGHFPDRCITVEGAVVAGLSAAPVKAEHEVAVVQYTSGSTGTPKAVLVTHANYMHNLRMLDEFVWSIGPQIDQTQVVSWLPQFHDMGLVLILFATWRSGTSTIIPPLAFLKDPGVWLRTISAVRGNVTGAPNFAFDLCTSKVSVPEVAELDLTSMAVMLNAAEPVRADTLNRFARHFGPAGLSTNAFAPCYGLAEGTVFVSGVRHGGSPRTVRFDRQALQIGIAVEEHRVGRLLVGCGRRPEGLSVRIVDPQTLVECGPNQIGEIWIHGPSVAKGYAQHDSAPDAFHAQLDGFDERHYLRTGDLGFLWEGELFVTGRAADAIEIDGRMLHPEDVEYTIERSIPVLHGRRCAVFPDGHEAKGLAAVVEVRLPLPLDPERQEMIEFAIRKIVRIEHGVELAQILLLPTGTIPVTTSGKVQRAKTRASYLASHG